MNEKVKVTGEVAEALKDLFSRNVKTYSKDEILKLHYRALTGGAGWLGEKWSHLNSLTMEEMAQAMFVGYEVKPEYRTGDWVRYWRSDSIAEIERIRVAHYPHGKFQTDSSSTWFPFENITRYATPEEIKAEKERRLWKSIGRKVGEFKIGDVGMYENGKILRVGSVIDVQGIRIMYKNGEIEGFYPAESFVEFGDEE